MRQIRNTVTILIGVAAGWWLLSQALGVLGRFADVLALFGFAWLLNLLLEPMVDAMGRRIPRVYAWAVGYLCVLAVLVGLAVPLATQASTLPAALPGALERATNQTELFLQWLQEHRIPVPPIAELNLANTDVTEITQQIGTTLLSWSLAVLSIGGQTLLVLGIAASMAAGDKTLGAIILALLPKDWVGTARQLYDDVRRTYSAAIRGQLAIWASGMALSLGAMAMFNTPGMLLWVGPLALVRLLPYLGGVLGGVLTVVILLLSLPWPQALIPVIIVIVGQNLLGYIVEPLLLGRALQLSPALVLFVVLVGWKLGGITGIAFGVPAVAVVQAVAERLIRQRDMGSLPPPPAPQAPVPRVAPPPPAAPNPATPTLSESARPRQ
jgi:predicted PurR-regulated permease PerM